MNCQTDSKQLLASMTMSDEVQMGEWMCQRVNCGEFFFKESSDNERNCIIVCTIV